MTIDKFMAKLEETPAHWCLTRGGKLRARNGVFLCPIEKVAGLTGLDGDNVQDAADKLMLSYIDRWTIIYAADNQRVYADVFPDVPAVRERLLRAVKLTSPEVTDDY